MTELIETLQSESVGEQTVFLQGIVLVEQTLFLQGIVLVEQTLPARYSAS